MKIGLLTEASAHGVGLHVISLAQMMSQQGHEVHLIFSPLRIDQNFRDGLGRLLHSHIIPLEMKRNPGIQDFRCIKFIRSYLKKHGPFDILHGHSSKGGSLLRLAAIGLPGAKIYTPHALITFNPTLPCWKRSAYLWAERILGTLTDFFIAETEEESDEARRIGISPKKIIVIPNGIEEPNFPDSQATRARLSLTEDEIVIGFVGRFSTQKGPEILIQAMGTLVENFPEHKIKLIMVGGGELKERLQELVQKLKIGAWVRWLGEVQSVVQMPAFDLLAFPSLYEGMPYVLIEALFAGRPIVATQVGGAKVMVESGVNGYLVPPGDPRGLAQAIGELIVDHDKRSIFGEASREKSQLFTLANMASRIESLYETIKAC